MRAQPVDATPSDRDHCVLEVVFMRLGRRYGPSAIRMTWPVRVPSSELPATRLNLAITGVLGRAAHRAHDLRCDDVGVCSVRICEYYYGKAGIKEHIGFCCKAIDRPAVPNGRVVIESA